LYDASRYAAKMLSLLLLMSFSVKERQIRHMMLPARR